MAIKTADQITIVDITDAYSVMLTSEAFAFTGTTTGVASGATCETQVVAFLGGTQCTKVEVTQANVVCPTGISATVTGSGTSAVTVKFTTTATVSASCEATIPVVVDGITVNKKFSFSIAKTGATGGTGATGAAGADALTLVITSTAGTIFKNSTGSTTLKSQIFKGGVEQTITAAGVCGTLGSVKWYKDGAATALATSKDVTVNATDVNKSAIYTAQLEL